MSIYEHYNRCLKDRKGKNKEEQKKKKDGIREKCGDRWQDHIIYTLSGTDKSIETFVDIIEAMYSPYIVKICTITVHSLELEARTDDNPGTGLMQEPGAVTHYQSGGAG